MQRLKDAHNRAIGDLRISLTDRCNFRCFYCLPNGAPPLARKETILTFEEIERAAEIFVSLGIEKIRLTGGEPLLRRDLPDLVCRLARLKPRPHDIAMTTNGYLFERFARDLRHAGLDRVTISLDSLQPARFKAITGVDGLDAALKAIDIAAETDFDRVKINVVVVRGRNDDEIADFAQFARDRTVSVRFIEFMPLDAAHGWQRELVVSAAEVKQTIERRFALRVKSQPRGSATAVNYEFADGAGGEIGFIAPVTEAFCGQCSRIRLTADGQIRTCLFSAAEHNLRDVMRSGAGRGEIVDFIRDAISKKEIGHRINETSFVAPSRSMSFIGG